MTALIWDGKYKDGKKAVLVKIALPFLMINSGENHAENIR